MSKAKKFFALLLALVMALTLFAGCGDKKQDDANKGDNPGASDNNPGNTDDQPGSDADANKDRVLRIATNGDTGTLYPLAASGGFVSLLYAFYEPVWTFDAENNKIFMLAESYEQADEEGMEWTMKLRQGVTFSNGNPMTADDVMFSMEMCKEDPRFYLNVDHIDFEKTKIVDEYTIDVWYTMPTYTQDNAFCQLMIMDKESFDAEYLSRNTVGTGPYICTDYVVNSHVTCEANPNYWAGEPDVKKLEFKVITESAQILNALEVGEIDVVSGIPADEAEFIESLDYNIDKIYGAYANTALFSFNGALATKEARYAVSYAMDRESMSQLMYKGLSSVPGYPTSEHCIDFEDRFLNLHDTYATGYSVEKAKEYAEMSGLVGKKLKIITNGMETFNDVATIIQSNLADIGVDSEIMSYDSATYFSIVMDETNFDIALFYLSSPSMRGGDIICVYPDFIPLGWKGAERDRYSELHQEIASTMDDKARGDVIYEALQLFVDVDPWFPICEAVTVAASTKDIGGVQYYLAGNLLYQDLYWN